MLRIVTGNKNVQLVKAVFVPALQGCQYKFEPLGDGIPKASIGDTIVMCGGAAVKLLQKQGLVPKGRTVNSLREKLWPHPDGGEIMVTYDPGLTNREIDKLALCQWDMKLAGRYDLFGTLKPNTGSYVYVDHFNAAIRHIRDGYESSGGKPIRISLDLETVGLDPFAKPTDDHPGGRIVTISITYKHGQADVYRVPAGEIPEEVRKQIKLICTSPKVMLVGANLKFDILWMFVHWGIWVTNQKFDTTLVGSLLDENTSNSLNMHAKLRTVMGGYDDDFNARFDKSRMDVALETDPESFLTYSGGDTDACLRVYDNMRKELLRDKALTNFYVKLLQPASMVFAKLEHRGVVVDREQYEKIKKKVKAAEEDLHNGLKSMLPRKLRIKYRDDLKMSRPVILREYLFTNKGLGLKPIMFTPKEKAPSTSLEHLEELLHQQPSEDLQMFVDGMREWGSAKKTLSTYVTGFMKHIRADGKFHPSYMLFRGSYGDKDDDSGTVSGRLSAKDPAWQTLPKHTIWARILRTVYKPPPGFAILKLDYSQGELRVTACVANEPTMIDTYKQGLDLHLRTGAMVNDIEFEVALQMLAEKHSDIKIIRQGGKAGNFGLIYGMGAEGFQKYARVTYGVHWSLDKCERVRNQFFSQYPKLTDWHKEYKKLAALHGAVRSPLGRVRHLPLIKSPYSDVRAAAQRQAINSPIQSTLSDMMLLAMVEIDKRYPQLWMFGMTHDEVQMYVPEGEVEQWAVRVKDVMENLPLHEFNWSPQLSFPVDAEASVESLAECKSLELAA